MQHLDLDNSEVHSHVVSPHHVNSVYLHPAVVISQKLKYACEHDHGEQNPNESWF